MIYVLAVAVAVLSILITIFALATLYTADRLITRRKTRITWHDLSRLR